MVSITGTLKQAGKSTCRVDVLEKMNIIDLSQGKPCHFQSAPNNHLYVFHQQTNSTLKISLYDKQLSKNTFDLINEVITCSNIVTEADGQSGVYCAIGCEDYRSLFGKISTNFILLVGTKSGKLLCYLNDEWQLVFQISQPVISICPRNNTILLIGSEGLICNIPGSKKGQLLNKIVQAEAFNGKWLVIIDGKGSLDMYTIADDFSVTTKSNIGKHCLYFNKSADNCISVANVFDDDMININLRDLMLSSGRFEGDTTAAIESKISLLEALTIENTKKINELNSLIEESKKISSATQYLEKFQDMKKQQKSSAFTTPISKVSSLNSAYYLDMKFDNPIAVDDKELELTVVIKIYPGLAQALINSNCKAIGSDKVTSYHFTGKELKKWKFQIDLSNIPLPMRLETWIGYISPPQFSNSYLVFIDEHVFDILDFVILTNPSHSTTVFTSSFDKIMIHDGTDKCTCVEPVGNYAKMLTIEFYISIVKDDRMTDYRRILPLLFEKNSNKLEFIKSAEKAVFQIKAHSPTITLLMKILKIEEGGSDRYFMEDDGGMKKKRMKVEIVFHCSSFFVSHQVRECVYSRLMKMGFITF